MNKKALFFILLLLVFLGYACVAVYPYTSFFYGNVEINYTPQSDSLTVENEGIILIGQQRVKGYIWDIRVFHDNKRNVTCWVFGDGVSCIPDSLLEVKEE